MGNWASITGCSISVYGPRKLRHWLSRRPRTQLSLSMTLTDCSRNPDLENDHGRWLTGVNDIARRFLGVATRISRSPRTGSAFTIKPSHDMTI